MGGDRSCASGRANDSREGLEFPGVSCASPPPRLNRARGASPKARAAAGPAPGVPGRGGGAPGLLEVRCPPVLCWFRGAARHAERPSTPLA